MRLNADSRPGSGQAHRILYCQATGGGGSLLALATLIDALDRQRWDPLVVFYRKPRDPDPLGALGVPTIVLGRESESGSGSMWEQPGLRSAGRTTPVMTLRQTRRLLASDLPLARRIARVAREHDVDLIHSNVHPFADRAAALAAGWARKPHVAHVRMDREHWRTVDGPLSMFVDAYVYVSEAVKRRFEEDVPAARGAGRVIYDPCSVRTIPGTEREAVRRELGVADDDVVLINVGTLTPRKGQDLFLEAVAELLPAHPTVKALVVGGADAAGRNQEPELRSLARRLGIEDNVRFTGHRDDAARLMAASELCVMSSRGPEGLPLVVVEAMLLGRPVVATDVGGTSEVLRDGETGWLVPPGDPGALSRALEAALAAPRESRRRAARARRAARSMFSAGAHGARVASLYEALLTYRRSVGRDV